MNIERLGPYEIVGQLGRGGMGVVYKAVHRETGDPAAVKLLSATMAQEEGFRSRFEAEIETLRKLNHPNIVRLLGFGEQDGHLFYAMEVVEGNSLEEELRQGRRFEWREVAQIGIETCRALKHAHDRGIIHRDIKPGNVLLTPDGHAKLSDFGIARLFGHTKLTCMGNVLGTAEYMAPEQAEGRPVDAKADLYSLGALMYALLARRPVFRGRSLPEMLHLQRFEQPDPVRKYAADVPEEMERILAQLLEKDPARRFPNADVLARRLEAMLHSICLSPETMAADEHWFAGDESPPTRPIETAPPDDGLPATQDLSRAKALTPPPLPEKKGSELFISAKEEKESAHREEETSCVPVSTPPVSTPVSTIPVSPTPSRFVVVDESELDSVDDEEPRSAMISWQTWALAAALLAVGLTVWWFLQPPTADSLFDRIEAKTADGSIDSISQAEYDIQKFLDLYSSDRRAAKLRKYRTEIELDRMQKEFNQTILRRHKTDKYSPIERAYIEALNYVQLDPEIGMAKLQAIVDLYGQPGRDPGPGQQCLVLASRRLAQLREEVKQRQAEQLDLLKDRLAAADALRKTDPARAKAMYRAIVELYGQKPWAVEAVRRAREGLSSEPPPKP